MKILIIDDSADSLRIAKSRLTAECDAIFCADGGKSGMELARREMPDLVLLDLDMPDMSGFEVCRELKSDPETCMIPVIFLSGVNTPEDKVKGLDLGAVDYVTKPFDAFELRARVRAALRTKHLQDLLVAHANIDPLTGLPNRRALQERMKVEWDRMKRHGGQLSFIMADIDRFKFINDTFGHHIGDRILQEVAQVFVRQCRNIDLPARYGGDEFAVAVPCDCAQNAARLAERCRKGVESMRLSVDDEIVAATLSLGVADSTGASSPEDLIEHADAALYQAKDAGRNATRCQQGADLLSGHDSD
jgi:diguanylate cyclase (GGDEF)-like protein